MTGPVPAPPSPVPPIVAPEPCWREILAAATEGRLCPRVGFDALLDRIEGRAR